MQGRNGDADVENGLVDTVGEGEDATNAESSIDIDTQSRVKWIAGEKLPCNTESPAPHCDVGGMGGGEGGSRGTRDTYYD